MNALVIGLGSMGRRRIRLLKKLKPDWQIIGVDSNAARSKSAQTEYHIKVFSNLKAAMKENLITCAFVSTSPTFHADMMKISVLQMIEISHFFYRLPFYIGKK